MKTKLIPVIILTASSLTLSTAVMADMVQKGWHTTTTAVDKTWDATGKLGHGIVKTTEKTGSHMWKGTKTFVDGTWKVLTSPFRN